MCVCVSVEKSLHAMVCEKGYVDAISQLLKQLRIKFSPLGIVYEKVFVEIVPVKVMKLLLDGIDHVASESMSLEYPRENLNLRPLAKIVMEKW